MPNGICCAGDATGSGVANCGVPGCGIAVLHTLQIFAASELLAEQLGQIHCEEVGGGGGLTGAATCVCGRCEAKPGRAIVHISHTLTDNLFRNVHCVHPHVSLSSFFVFSRSCSRSSSFRKRMICSKCRLSASSSSVGAGGATL